MPFLPFLLVLSGIAGLFGSIIVYIIYSNLTAQRSLSLKHEETMERLRLGQTIDGGFIESKDAEPLKIESKFDVDTTRRFEDTRQN